MAERKSENTRETETELAQNEQNPFKKAMSKTHVMKFENSGTAYLKGGSRGIADYFNRLEDERRER